MAAAVFVMGIQGSGSRGVLVCWVAALIFWMYPERTGIRGLRRCTLAAIALGILPTIVLGILPAIVPAIVPGILSGSVSGVAGGGISGISGIGNAAGEIWARLLVWDNTSLAERGYLARDAWRLAVLNSFWPAAGGWHAYPLVDEVAFRSSDPHSSLLSVLLNQGGPGVVLVLLWGAEALRCVVAGRRGSREDGARCGGVRRGGSWALVAGLVFLGTHSMVDADLAFGCVGFLFWIFAGVASFTPSRRSRINTADASSPV